MDLKNFIKEVDQKILERGRDYYEHGCVKDLVKIQKGKWLAKVHGNNIYEVIVETKDNEILNSECNCPYDWGSICKHEVAVFLEVFDKINNHHPEKKIRETKESKLEKALEKESKEELQKIIIEKALEDENFYNYLTLCFQESSPQEDRLYFKKIIRKALNSIKGSKGFIDYYKARESADVGWELLENAKKLFDKKKYRMAMNISQALIEVYVPSLDYTDDSDGLQGTIIEEAFSLLFRIAETEKLRESFRQETFAYYLKQSEKKVYDDYDSWQHFFIKLAILLHSSQKDLLKLLKVTEKNIEVELKGESSSEYKISKFSMIKYEILLKLEKLKEAESFFESCLKFSEFREMKLEKLFQDKNYKEVIKIAFEGEKKDSTYPGLVFTWQKWRFKAYEELGEIENIEKLAFKMLVEHREFKYYEAYKKAVPDKDWSKKYQVLKKELENKNVFSEVLAKILIQEKEFFELLNMVKKKPYYVDSYQQYLLKDYPEEIYELHIKNIRDESNFSGDRKKYRALCQKIKDLKKIGGVDQANFLIKELQNTYSRRPTFLDELSKV